jgi:phytoene dehydrogenase-like protein
LDVLVLEAADHVGGRMNTIETDGYRIDTGAGFPSSAANEMTTLIAEAGLIDHLAPSSSPFGI